MWTVWCNTQVVTSPQPLDWREQHGGGRPLRKRLTLIYCIFTTWLVQVLITYLAYSVFLVFTWVVEVLLTTREEGLEVCWLHLATTMVKECWLCCGSSFLIIPPWFKPWRYIRTGNMASLLLKSLVWKKSAHEWLVDGCLIGCFKACLSRYHARFASDSQ